jgi:serine/threonine protein kinase
MSTIRLDSKINSGGFGEVFRATIVDDGRKVAVKRLLKPYSSDDVKRFGREVRIMEKLDHPNIIKVLRSNLDADPPVFVMPLAECNLNDILPDLRQNEERRRFIFQQILEGMQYAHESGVIHRDIKPQNILIMKGDRIAITDFGIGRFLVRDTTTLTMQGDQFGTIAYAAPEQLADFSQTDVRSDIYALGKILYQMLSSRPVFPILNLTGLEGKYVYIIQKCVDNDPDKRYQTVSELIADFELLTQKEFNVESPTQLAQKLVGEIVDPFSETVNSKGLVELAKIFMENPDNEDLYLEVLPKMPDEIISKLIISHNASFLSIIQTYDGYVSGNLAFSYCDTVARFYEKIFWEVDNFQIKRLVFSRLLDMGSSHHRFYVRDVMARMVHEIKDVGLARLVLDVYRNNTSATQWASASINLDKVHPLIRDGIREINKPSDEETEIFF